MALAIILLIVVHLKDRRNNKPVVSAMISTANKFREHIDESKEKDAIYEKYMKASTENIEVIKNVFVEVRQLIHEQGAQLIEVKQIIVKHDERLNNHDNEIEKVKVKVKRLEERQ